MEIMIAENIEKRPGLMKNNTAEFLFFSVLQQSKNNNAKTVKPDRPKKNASGEFSAI